MTTKKTNPTIDKMNQVIACFHRRGKKVVNKNENKKGGYAWEVRCSGSHGGKPAIIYRRKMMCEYHKDWNLLMEVIHKIEKKTEVMDIRKDSCALKGDLPYWQGKTTMLAVHRAVYETILTLK